MTLSATKILSPEVTRRRSHRRWTDEQKHRMIAECDEPGASVSIVARRHDVNTNMLFNWRRSLRRAENAAVPELVAFVPAVITPDPSQPWPVPQEVPRRKKGGSTRPACSIEIVLTDGCRVVVGGDVRSAALTRVLDVLERRR